MKKYIIRDGDTMWNISKATGVRLNLLMAANPQITDPNQLKPGTVIVIPELTKPKGMPSAAVSSAGATPGPQSASSSKTGVGSSHTPPYFGFVWPHVVKPGETWESIAGRYRVSLKHLLHVNPYPEGSLPREGEVVYVPRLAEQGEGAPPTVTSEYGMGHQGLLGPGMAPSATVAPYQPGVPQPGTGYADTYPSQNMYPTPDAYPYSNQYPYPYQAGAPYGGADGYAQQPMSGSMDAMVGPMGPHTHSPYRFAEQYHMPPVAPYPHHLPYQMPHMPVYPMHHAMVPHKPMPMAWHTEWDDSSSWSSSWSSNSESSWSSYRSSPNERETGLTATASIENFGDDEDDEQRQAERQQD